MPEQTIILKTWKQHQQEQEGMLIGFLILLGIGLLIVIFLGIKNIWDKNPFVLIASFGTLILFLFRKKIFKKNHKVEKAFSKESLKAFFIYFIIYSLGIYIIFNVPPFNKIQNIFLFYAVVGIFLTIFGKIGGLIVNKKLVINKYVPLWVLVYALFFYIFFELSLFVPFKFPRDIIFSFIFGLWITLASRFAWNSMYRRY